MVAEYTMKNIADVSFRNNCASQAILCTQSFVIKMIRKIDAFKLEYINSNIIKFIEGICNKSQ